MSQQPAPIDVNRLKNILGGAKAIMNKVDSGDYQKGNVQLDETVTSADLLEGNRVQSQMQNTGSVAPKMRGNQPTYKNIETSRMPDAIKKAMMNQPIPQLSGPNHTFNLDDVSDLVDKPIPTNYQQTRQQPQPHRPINESIQQNSNDTFTVSETALRGIIRDVVKDELLGFMNETYSKSLTEQAIKKTISTLIKEGKIRTKKKVNS